MWAELVTRSPARAENERAAEIRRVRETLARTDPESAEYAPLRLQLGTLLDEDRRARDVGSDGRTQGALDAVDAWRPLYEDPQYRDYEHRDRALFGAAYLLFEEGRGPEAQRLFQRLLDEHQHSEYVAEAAVGRGEDAFEQGEMAGARGYYERVLAYPDSVLYRYALFKIGWTHVNQDQPEKAAAAFERAIEVDTERQPRPATAAALLAECKKSLEQVARDLTARLATEQGMVCEKPCPLSDEERTVLRAYDRYVTAVADKGGRPILEYRPARIYYEHGMWA
jgi:tetratricopeptide (TPR) repeat protein